MSRQKFDIIRADLTEHDLQLSRVRPDGGPLDDLKAVVSNMLATMDKMNDLMEELISKGEQE